MNIYTCLISINEPFFAQNLKVEHLTGSEFLQSLLHWMYYYIAEIRTHVNIQFNMFKFSHLWYNFLNLLKLSPASKVAFLLLCTFSSPPLHSFSLPINTPLLPIPLRSNLFSTDFCSSLCHLENNLMGIDISRQKTRRKQSDK